MKALIETIVRPIVDYPDDVAVTEQEEERKLTYHLSVHKDDVGKVIGRHGRVAKAIRTVVYAAGSNSKKRIYLDIM
ncbi:KH domain-containing protein [Pontibacillus salipaludis]|uniref:KH domain-containing protein n=1 Tax=Pontibacillus salipaludis TaxID=1697394 RepID=UPI0031EB85ED